MRSAPTTSPSSSWRARAGPASSWAAAPGARAPTGAPGSATTAKPWPPSTGARSGSSRSCARARRRRRAPVVLEAPIGPRGDAYAPETMMSAEEAERYHSAQMQTLSDTAVDLITALTITYAEEAIGMVRAARAAGPAGRGLLHGRDGRPPAERPDAARRDRAGRRRDGRSAAPLHDQLRAPDPLRGGAGRRRAVERRIRGLRANASTLSHAELDEAEDLDDGDPADLADAPRRAARRRCPNLTILGGCCGTDIRHVTSICDAWISA